MTGGLDSGSHPVPAKLGVVDLFAGCGGLTSGFHRTGRYAPKGAVEFDLAAASTYAANFGERNIFWGDITDWVQGDLPAADVVIGGPPCQGFSTLGKREIDDPRNLLWRQYVNALVKIRPKVFLLENVPQFRKSGQFEDLHQMVKSGVLKDYDIDYAVVLATDFGAAQLRRRFIVIGTRRDHAKIEIPSTKLDPNSWKTVRQAIGDLQDSVDPANTSLPDGTAVFFDQEVNGVFKSTELDFARTYSRKSQDRMSYIPAEGDRQSIPVRLMPPCWIGRTAGMDVYGRLRWDKPSVTIRTEFFKPEKGRYLHPVMNRALSHHEAARLQGFDDTFLWCGNRSEIARQIGNAVPVDLAEGLATHIADGLESGAGKA